MPTVAPEVPVLARDEAFEQLYRRYVKDVYHYALALLRDPADAEDVTQTTFLNAYRAYKRGEEIRKPQNWLIKITHNVARSRYARSSRRVKEVPLEEHVDRLALPEDDKPNVEGVLNALGTLPFNQRAALVMRELEGRSYGEIADTLGVSVAAVETLIFRARRSLRVRTAALRSILTAPVPSSLTQFFGGGGAGAAGAAGAAGGLGTGTSFLIKAAVALVVGGLATGLAVEGSKRASASPEHGTAPGAPARPPATVPAHAAHRGRVHVRAARRPAPVAPARASAREATPSPRPSTEQAAVAPTPAPAPSGSAPAPPPPSPIQSVTSVAENTVQGAVGTVDQALDSLPLAAPQPPQVPALPVQTPPLPQLP